MYSGIYRISLYLEKIMDEKKCSRCEEQRNIIVHQGAILEWIMDVLYGREVSDFALSHPIVQQVYDLKSERI